MVNKIIHNKQVENGFKIKAGKNTKAMTKEFQFLETLLTYILSCHLTVGGTSSAPDL
jgi:hypothetical protein